MINRNFFDHVNPDGDDPTGRANKIGYTCRKDYGSYYTEGIAENIQQNWLYESVTTYNFVVKVYNWYTQEELVQVIVNGWMNSPRHRQNILTSTYDKEGIGVAVSENKEVLITEDFC